MRTSPLLADFIQARGCKPICEKSLTLPFLQGIRPANFGIFHFINLKRYRSNSPYNKITEKCFLLLSVILFAFATPDKLFCSILRYQSVALRRVFFYCYVRFQAASAMRTRTVAPMARLALPAGSKVSAVTPFMSSVCVQ